MKKSVLITGIAVFCFMVIIREVKASVIDELDYVNDKSDIFSYVNFNSISKFLMLKRINQNDLDILLNDNYYDDNEKTVSGFGIKTADLDEMLIVLNSEDIDKKTGFLVFTGFKKGKGFIPESLKKNSISIYSATAYRLSADEDIYFTKIDDILVAGPRACLDSFMRKRSSGKTPVSQQVIGFKKNVFGKSLYTDIIVSEHLKESLKQFMNTGAGQGRGLQENVFIQTLLSLEKINLGMDIGNSISFYAGLTGSKQEDSERLQMLCHTWIVSSSLAVSFADLMAAKTGESKPGGLSSDRETVSWLQKSFGRIHVVQMEKGVTINFEMRDSETDVLAAFIQKEVSIVKKERSERLERGKITRLTKAIADKNYTLMNYFIKEKFNLNAFDNDGNTPLCAAVKSGDIKAVKILIEKGAGLNIFNIDRLAPIHIAVKSDNKDMVLLLLNKGCNVNIAGENGFTPLHLNAMKGNSAITKLLIAKGAELNMADSEGSTPLYHASATGMIKTVEVLVEKKADPEIKNIYGRRAIDIASQNNHRAIVKFLGEKFNQQPVIINENETNEDYYKYKNDYSDEDDRVDDEKSDPGD